MNSKVSIHSLPHDVMRQIFGYFSSEEIRKTLALVCKRWLTLSRDSYFLKEMCVNRQKGSANFIPKTSLLSLVCCAKQLTRFTIENEKFVAPVFLALAQNCPNITILEATNCQNLSDTAMKQLTTSCVRLTTLNLEGTTGVFKGGYRYIGQLRSLTHMNIELCGSRFDANSTCLDRQGFIDIVTNCPLQSLLLFDSSEFCISDLEFSFLAKRLDSLKELSLNTSEMTSQGFLFIANFRNLELLHIGGVSTIREDVHAISQLRNLRTLRLAMQNDQYVSCAAFVELFQTNAMANLAKLELQNFTNIEDEVCMMLALYCRRLAIVHTYITDEGGWLLANHCRDLKVIDLSYNSELHGECFVVLGRNLAGLKKLILEPRLEGRKEANLILFRQQWPDVVITAVARGGHEGHVPTPKCLDVY